MLKFTANSPFFPGFAGLVCFLSKLANKNKNMTEGKMRKRRKVIVISDDEEDDDEEVTVVAKTTHPCHDTSLATPCLKFEETLRFDPTHQPIKITKVGRSNPLSDKIKSTRTDWLEKYRHTFCDDGTTSYRCVLEIRVPKSFLEEQSKLAYGPHGNIPCVDIVKTILDMLSNRGNDKGLLVNDARISYLESRIVSHRWAMNSTFAISVELARLPVSADVSHLIPVQIDAPHTRQFILTLDHPSSEIQPKKQMFAGSDPSYDKEQRQRIADTISLVSMQNRQAIEVIRLFMNKSKLLPSRLEIQVHYPRKLKEERSKSSTSHSTSKWKSSAPDIDNVCRLLIVVLLRLSLISTTSVTQIRARKLVVGTGMTPSTEIRLVF